MAAVLRQFFVGHGGWLWYLGSLVAGGSEIVRLDPSTSRRATISGLSPPGAAIVFQLISQNFWT